MCIYAMWFWQSTIAICPSSYWIIVVTFFHGRTKPHREQTFLSSPHTSIRYHAMNLLRQRLMPHDYATTIHSAILMLVCSCWYSSLILTWILSHFQSVIRISHKIHLGLNLPRNVPSILRSSSSCFALSCVFPTRYQYMFFYVVILSVRHHYCLI